MLGGLRRFQLCSPRVAGCGHRRISSDVEVRRARVERDDGSGVVCAHYSGLLQCGSVWECPVCAGKIRAERTAEVRQAAEQCGFRQTYMLTLTVRHSRGNDLREGRRGLADAFRRFVRGEPWLRLAGELGLEHWIRAMEVTHGPNGWHPHLHVLWFLEAPLVEGEPPPPDVPRAPDDPAYLSEVVAKLSERWGDCVARELGESARPNRAHGLDLRPCASEDYISKFAFELVDPAAAKAAAHGHRSPWQIAIGASWGDELDGVLWRQYCAGMRGAKMLTWSRGLRAFAGLDVERDDQEVVEQEPEGAEVVAVLPSHVWDALRYRQHLACAVLEAAELAASAAEAHRSIQAIADSPLLALRARAIAAA